MAFNLKFATFLVACIFLGFASAGETGTCCKLTKPILTVIVNDLFILIKGCIDILIVNLNTACGGTCVISGAVAALIVQLNAVIAVSGPLLAWLTPTFAAVSGSAVSLSLFVGLVLIICCFIVTLINIIIKLILGPCTVALGNITLIVIVNIVIFIKCIVVIISALDAAVGSTLTLLIALIDFINVAVVACVNACIAIGK